MSLQYKKYVLSTIWILEGGMSVVSCPHPALEKLGDLLHHNASARDGCDSELAEIDRTLAVLQAGETALREMDRAVVATLRQQGIDNSTIVAMMELSGRRQTDIVAAFFGDDGLAIIKTDPEEAAAEERAWLNELGAHA
jgi:hypothetical protein